MKDLIADELPPELFLYAACGWLLIPSIDGDCDYEWLSRTRLLF